MFRIRSVFTGVAGSPYYSNLFFANGSEESQQAALDAVRAIWQAYSATLRSPMTVEVESNVPTIDPTTGEITSELTLDPPDTVTFTSTNEALPPANQLQVNLRTGVFFGGRQVRGICYVPGWTIASNTVIGRPEQEVRTGTAEAFAALISLTAPLVVWSRKNGEAVPVQNTDVGAEWAILRSRRD